MKQIIIGGLSIVAIFTPAYAEINCCSSCKYNTSDTIACTQECCFKKYGVSSNQSVYSDPDSNGVVTVTTYTETVQCGLNSNEMNSVFCSAMTSYTCAKGYYGRPSDFDKTCTRCPAYMRGSYGTTARMGAKKITECYVPSGSGFTEMTSNGIKTGKGTYTGDCYYTE